MGWTAAAPRREAALGGIGKSVGGAVLGLGELIRSLFGAETGTSGTADALMGPVTEAEQPFKTAADIAQFAIPGMGASKLGMAGRMGVEALGGAGITAAQGGTAEQAGVSGLLGAAAPVAGRAASAAADYLPGKLINGLIKPLEKQFRFGRNPGRAVAEEGITANSQPEMLQAINARLSEVGENIGQMLDNVAGADQPSIDISPMLRPLQEAAEKALRVGDTGLAKRLLDFADAPIFKEADLLTPRQAAEVKRAVGESTQWTGETFDKPINQAKSAVYRAINDAVSEAVPGVRPLQQRYADLLGAAKALERTMNVEQRGSPVNLLDLLSIGGGLYGGGGDPVDAAAAFAGRRAIGSTAFMTRAAQGAQAGLPAMGALAQLLARYGQAQQASPLAQTSATPQTIR